MKWAAVLLALLLQTTPADKATISGVVVKGNTGEPIAGMRVALARTDISASPLAQIFGSSGSTELTLSGETLAAMVAASEAEAVRSGASPEAAARAALFNGLSSADIAEVLIHPVAGMAVVSSATPPETTDERGRFNFTNVQPGTYRLIFSGDGYSRQDFGQRTATGTGIPIKLAAGEAKTDIVMRLAPAGAISGQIRNENGEPAVGVPVQILRVSYDSGGRKQIERIAATLSDDRGEYRMFYLTPGRYYLSAGYQAGQLRNGQIRTRYPLSTAGYSSSNGVPRDYALTYYPGVPDQDSAGVIDIAPGVDTQGIDFRVRARQTYRVRGRVIDPTGQPPAAITITMNVLSDELTLTSGGVGSQNYKPADGSFEISNVSPGAYTITVSSSESQPRIRPPDFSAMSPQEITSYYESQSAVDRARPRAYTAVNLVNADVDGVVLSFDRSKTILGHFRIDPSTSPAIAFGLFRVQLIMFGSGKVTSTLTDPVYRTPDANGNFRIDNVLPGEYRIAILGVPSGFYLKEMRLGDTDLSSGRLVLSRTSSDAMEIVLSPNVGTISGSAQPGAQVVLIPMQNRERGDLFRTAVVDTTGRFAIPSVAPGEYILAAWEVLEPYGFFDRDAIRDAEKIGKVVRIAESSIQSVDVLTIPPSGR